MRPRLALPATLLALALALVPATAQARTLSHGDRGADVRNLNRALIALGHLPPGEPSRTYSARTVHAVMAFQKWERLARDGVAGDQTRGRLASARRPTPRTTRAGRRIEVLYDRQVALLIRRGVVERTIAVSTGAAGYRTPPGAFKVFRKERNSWSVPYSVWLPYASYFTGGVAFHAYPEVPPYPASHGCVRVPEPFAAELYAFARKGTRVDVLYPGTEIGGDEAPLGPYGP